MSEESSKTRVFSIRVPERMMVQFDKLDDLHKGYVRGEMFAAFVHAMEKNK